jgi:nucleotide-binding universal stress UspA family protein
MRKKILLATDFSEAARRAGEVAVALAKRAGDALVLLHVAEPLLHVPAIHASALEEALAERALSELQAVSDELRAGGMAVEERLAKGDPPELIAAVAKEVGARMIVLGTSGRRAVARLLLGSVAQHALLHADRTVLVAREGPEPVGLREWSSGARPLRVTLAIDRSRGSSSALAWVRWLREIGPADLRLVHVYDPVVEGARLGRSSARASLEAALEEELRGFVREVPGTGQVSFALRASPGRPGEVVAREAEASGADLLVVGTHQRSRVRRIWLGSTAELALRAARVPVVCVPASSLDALEDTGRVDEVC